jgi:LacI family transcriptional regulator
VADDDTPQTSGATRPRPTVTDVARRAGVSQGTVSKAINDTGQLRPETRRRVLAAAAELGFEPNAQARSLKSGRTYTVGLLTSDSFGRFSIPVLQGVEDALGAGSISVLLCDARGDAERERQYVRTLLSRRVDGIIVTARKTDARPSIGVLPVPVVYAYSQSDNPDDRAVIPDDVQAGRLAAEHLVAGGRRRIAYVSGPDHSLAVQRREVGARLELEARGLALRPELVRYGPWSEEWGRQAAATLLAEGQDFDAVFCGSDQIGRGVADGLRDAGIRMPDDVAVVGVDNWGPIATSSRPPLTTVDLQLEEVGRVAADELLARIAGELQAGVRLLPCRLVVRESSQLPVAVGPNGGPAASPL